MRFIALSAILALYCLPALSQITLEQSAYEELLETGYQNYISVEQENLTIDLGTPGSTDNVYDFSQVEFDTSAYNVQYIDPSTTPYADDYTDATHALYSNSRNTYHYYKLDQDAYYDLMEVFNVNEDRHYVRYAPALPALKFPLNLGDSWEYQSVIMEVDFRIRYFTKYRCSYDVVAAGTIVTKTGSEPCLVLKENSVSEILIQGTSSTIHNVRYRILDSRGAGATFFIDTLDEKSQTPRITYLIVSSIAPTGVQSAPANNMMFYIQPMFPNPATANGNNTAMWSNARAMSVKLTLHDIRGAKLATIFEGQAGPGTHSAPVHMQSLPQGMYFLRMITPNGVQTQKVIKMD